MMEPQIDVQDLIDTYEQELAQANKRIIGLTAMVRTYERMIREQKGEGDVGDPAAVDN